MTTSERVTLVTVVFEPEVGLLRLQARSLAMWLADELVECIMVVDNTQAGLSSKQWRRISSAYGHLSPRVVRVVVADLTGAVSEASGWRTQQVAKIAAARVVPTRWYVALDAKNIAVRPIAAGSLFAEDGRAKMGRHSYYGHPLESQVARTLELAGVDPSALERFPVTHTPFLFETARARALFEGETTAGDVVKLILAGRALEFPMYSAVLMHDGDLDKLYSSEVVQSPGLWPRGIRPETVAEFVQNVSARDDVSFVGLHRSALARLGFAATLKLADMIVERGLATHRSAAIVLLLRIRASIVLGALRRRLRVRLP